jgi:hypothetical protein
MVDFYVMQIRLGKIEVEDVPERFREAVSEKLDSPELRR